MKQPYLLLGEIVKPQGIRGEVKLRHYTDDPGRFLELETVYLGAERRPCRVLKARVQQDDVFLTLEGVPDRNAAEELRNTEVFVDRAHARALEGDRVFIADILGCRAVDTKGRELGILKDVLSPATVDVYVIRRPEGGTLMVPALKDVILSTDIDTGVIVLDEERLPEVALYEEEEP